MFTNMNVTQRTRGNQGNQLPPTRNTVVTNMYVTQQTRGNQLPPTRFDSDIVWSVREMTTEDSPNIGITRRTVKRLESDHGTPLTTGDPGFL
jgi:hypothetical protein